MLTEATRVLEEGIVREPSDVDMGLILGIGFSTGKGWDLAVGRFRRCRENRGNAFKFTNDWDSGLQPPKTLKRLAADGRGLFA